MNNNNLKNSLGGSDHEKLDLQAPKTSVLSLFSPEAGESVAFLLIRELIESVDRPQHNVSKRELFKSENQLEWIMQVATSFGLHKVALGHQSLFLPANAEFSRL